MPRTSEDEYFITVEGPDKFVELSDTPSEYTGEAGKVATVNGTEDGLIFTTVSGGGSGAQGQYTPQISNLTDIGTLNFNFKPIYQREDNCTTITVKTSGSFDFTNDTNFSFRMEIPSSEDEFASVLDVIGFGSGNTGNAEASCNIAVIGSTTQVNGKSSVAVSGYVVPHTQTGTVTLSFGFIVKIYRA